MAFSGTISATTFNALKVVDHAFRRCRLPAQGITAEMHTYALENLYLALSELANPRVPSWCIERQIYPFYEGQYQVNLDLGTVSVLNANLRTLGSAGGTVSSNTTTLYQVTSPAVVNTVGVKWTAAAVTLVFQTSADAITWTTVGGQTTVAASGSWTWTDIVPALAANYFRITSIAARVNSEIYLGTSPSETPMGVLNRDQFVDQNNKVFQGRPLTYWFQRNISRPVINLWPAPNAAAEHQQLIVWRHRHIMDTATLQQDVEVPQRWLEAIVSKLASKVAAETPAVDINLIPMLDAKAGLALQAAWEGDSDSSPTFFQPSIGVYTA